MIDNHHYDYYCTIKLKFAYNEISNKNRIALFFPLFDCINKSAMKCPVTVMDVSKENVLA